MSSPKSAPSANSVRRAIIRSKNAGPCFPAACASRASSRLRQTALLWGWRIRSPRPNRATTGRPGQTQFGFLIGSLGEQPDRQPALARKLNRTIGALYCRMRVPGLTQLDGAGCQINLGQIDGKECSVSISSSTRRLSLRTTSRGGSRYIQFWSALDPHFALASTTTETPPAARSSAPRQCHGQIRQSNKVPAAGHRLDNCQPDRRQPGR